MAKCQHLPCQIGLNGWSQNETEPREIWCILPEKFYNYYMVVRLLELVFCVLQVPVTVFKILYTCSIGTDVNLRKHKHQNVPIAYPNSKYKCRQFTQFSMGTKNKQSSAKCLVLVDKLQAYWSCSLTKLYWRLVPPQLTAARRRRHCRGGLNSLYRTYRASTTVVWGDFLFKKYLRQFLILGFLILGTSK